MPIPIYKVSQGMANPGFKLLNSLGLLAKSGLHQRKLRLWYDWRAISTGWRHRAPIAELAGVTARYTALIDDVPWGQVWTANGASPDADSCQAKYQRGPTFGSLWFQYGGPTYLFPYDPVYFGAMLMQIRAKETITFQLRQISVRNYGLHLDLAPQFGHYEVFSPGSNPEYGSDDTELDTISLSAGETYIFQIPEGATRDPDLEETPAKSATWQGWNWVGVVNYFAEL